MHFDGTNRGIQAPTSLGSQPVFEPRAGSFAANENLQIQTMWSGRCCMDFPIGSCTIAHANGVLTFTVDVGILWTEADSPQSNLTLDIANLAIVIAASWELTQLRLNFSLSFIC
jgi:hypothetical protein